jgi:hypothetical protein
MTTLLATHFANSLLHDSVVSVFHVQKSLAVDG